MGRGGGGQKDSDGRISGGGFGGGGSRYHDFRTRKAAVLATSGAPRPNFTNFEEFREWAARDPYYREWYNTVSPEVRWDRSLRGALEFCPKDPGGRVCRMYMELLVDCPPEKLEGYNLPPPGVRTESVLLSPLKLKDPLSSCKMWKTMLKWCRTNNTHYDSLWMWVPYEGFVQDDCPSDKRAD